MDNCLFSRDLISVVVPVYNSEEYIIQALESLKKQSYENFEVLIVDGSTDNTPNIIDTNIQDDDRFHVYRVINNGPGFARNYGISRASGSYITFMDHDDIVHRDWLFELYSLIISTRVDIVFCSGFYNIYKDDSVETFQTEVSRGVYLLNKKLKMRLSHGWIAPWLKMTSLKFIKNHNIQFSLDNAFDDVLFHFMSIHFASTVAFCDKPLYYHRIHNGSVTSIALVSGNMFFYHFKTLYDMLNDGCDAQLINMFMRFIKYYRGKVASREKYQAIYTNISLLLADGNTERAKDIAMLGIEHINPNYV